MNNKFLQNLLIVLVVGAILYLGKSVLVPISYGLFLALLLYPVCSWLERRHIPRSISIFLSMLLLLLPIVGLIGIMVGQVMSLHQYLPALELKIMTLLADVMLQLEKSFGISKQMWDQWGTQAFESSVQHIFNLVSTTLSASLSGTVLLIIIPVYSFLILYSRERLVRVTELAVPDYLKGEIKGILHKAVNTYVGFIKGMGTVYLIVGILNSIGLLLLGIPNAILFGFIASILTFIPYVGIMIASILPIIVSWTLYDSIYYPLGVIGIYAAVQYLEANIIFPWAVSQRVNVSTLMTLVAIFAGGLVWGGAGMILFVPFMAITRIIAAEIKGGEALALLLGGDDELPPPN